MYRKFRRFLGQIILKQPVQLRFAPGPDPCFQSFLIRLRKRIHRAGEDVLWLGIVLVPQGNVAFEASQQESHGETGSKNALRVLQRASLLS